MPNFSIEIFQNYISAFRESFAFIVQAFRGFIDVIKSSPLYYMPLVFFLLLGMVFMIVWLIQTVSMNIGNTKYNVNAYANCNRLYSDGLKSYMNPWAFYAGRKYDRYKKQKEQSTALIEDWAKADEFFHNNPHKMSVRLNGKTFYNGDNWYKRSWGSEGKMKHTISYKREKDGTYKPVKESHTTTEVEDD